jgi:hypothetical protein
MRPFLILGQASRSCGEALATGDMADREICLRRLTRRADAEAARRYADREDVPD